MKTLTIIFSALLLLTLNTTYGQSSLSKKGCKKFRTGTFTQTVTGFGTVKIERKKKTQIETYQKINGTITSDINWTGDCTYDLTIKDTNKKLFQPYVGKTLHIEIINIKGDTCTTVSHMDNDPHRDTNSMIKIKK